MTSQLNVDTIVEKAGSCGSNVKMANTSTYVSDGGNVTQNTVQGLAKLVAGCTLAGSLNAASSLNVSSLADGGTGLNTVNATNAFSAAKAAVPSATIHDALYSRAINIDDTSASAFITRVFTSDGGALTDDNVDSAVVIHGDLA